MLFCAAPSHNFKMLKEKVKILLLTMVELVGNIMFFVLCSVFADGQLQVVWPAMGNLPPISLPPALSHLSYLPLRAH